jgi:hypothetical protein
MIGYRGDKLGSVNLLYYMVKCSQYGPRSGRRGDSCFREDVEV